MYTYIFNKKLEYNKASLTLKAVIRIYTNITMVQYGSSYLPAQLKYLGNKQECDKLLKELIDYEVQVDLQKKIPKKTTRTNTETNTLELQNQNEMLVQENSILSKQLEESTKQNERQKKDIEKISNELASQIEINTTLKSNAS